MFTPEELKALEEAGTQTAEITEFVPLEAIDPVFFDKAYYLAPKGRREALCAARESAARIETLRARTLGRARQAVHRDDPPRRTGPRDAAASLRQRSAVDERYRDPADRSQGRGIEARAAIDRAAGLGDVRSIGLYGRSAHPHRSGHAEEGRRPGDHGDRSAGGRRPGDRSHGSAACEPRKKPAAKAPEVRVETRKPPRRAQAAESAPKKAARR